MDFDKLADEIVQQVGGPENVNSLSHCATRLRFVLKDEAQADLSKLRNLPGVLGATFGAGQLQVVMGGKVLDAFDAIQKKYQSFDATGTTSDQNQKPVKLTWRSAGKAALDFISGSVSTVVTGLIAGSMVKLALYIVSLIWPAVSAMGTFKLLTIVSDVPFYFMPLFIAYGASKKLNMQPVYPFIVAAALLHPDWNALVSGGHAQSLFGLPVLLTSYSTTLIPTLLSTIAVFYIEKYLNKIIPGILKTILVGALTIVIGATLAFTVFGPLGIYIGKYIIAGIVWLNGTIGPITLGILAGILPLLVMMGMHTLFVPFMLQNFTSLGYDPLFKPALFLHVIAEGGAALGVALRTKDKVLRSQAWTLGLSSIFAGISEPVIFGLGVKYKRPMIAAMIGGFSGGIVAGLMNVRQYLMSKTTLLALPTYKGTIMGMVIGILVTLVVSMIVAYILGIGEEKSTNELTVQKSTTAPQSHIVVAPVSGQSMSLTEVDDDVFSQKMLGDGLAFTEIGDSIVAPMDGQVSAVFPTGHAIGMTTADGVETLIHIGLNTVSLKGQGFSTKVAMGQSVHSGEELIHLDLNYLQSTGLDLTTMLIFTDSKGEQLDLAQFGSVVAGSSQVATVAPENKSVSEVVINE